MKRRTLLYLGLGLSALLSVLNYVALILYFYWTVWWFDTMMHFLGGLTLGVLVVWLLKIEKRSWGSFIGIFICVMVLGVVWEIFEYVSGITFLREGYMLDTIHDLVMDAAGLIAAYVIILPTSSHLAVKPPSDRILL
jgi:hypothetical protein